MKKKKVVEVIIAILLWAVLSLLVFAFYRAYRSVQEDLEIAAGSYGRSSKIEAPLWME